MAVREQDWTDALYASKQANERKKHYALRKVDGWMDESTESKETKTKRNACVDVVCACMHFEASSSRPK
jgi:hypothetical protein